MNIKINKEKYNVKKRDIGIDEFQYTITPKRRTCKLCGKGFDSGGSKALSWTDDNDFYRIGYFCRTHYRLVKKVLIEKKRKRLD